MPTKKIKLPKYLVKDSPSFATGDTGRYVTNTWWAVDLARASNRDEFVEALTAEVNKKSTGRYLPFDDKKILKVALPQGKRFYPFDYSVTLPAHKIPSTKRKVPAIAIFTSEAPKGIRIWACNDAYRKGFKLDAVWARGAYHPGYNALDPANWWVSIMPVSLKGLDVQVADKLGVPITRIIL